MKQQISKKELILVAGALAVGFFLRFADLDQLAVEHFDEGVYSSSVWYHQLSNEVYPSRHLYAPPALPSMIGVASAIFGPDYGPFVPALLTGVLTVLLIWRFTREAFGMVAGLMVVFLAAFSDFHVLYSRMALTDVPTLMWIVLAVRFGVLGIDRRCGRTMMLAGLACGCAWWTKYTGWLPLAIVSSGSVFWWVISGRRQLGLGRLVALNAIMAITAAVVWSPWLWALQSTGGYAAVAANHDAYRTGWESWQENLATQITWYTSTESWLSTLAVAMGLLFAGCHRWFDARRSTWNRSASEGVGITPGLLARFIGATIVLSIATLTIGSFGVLAALAIGGMTGMFLWPVMNALKDESSQAIAVKYRKPGHVLMFDRHDYDASATLDPQLAACVVTVWLCGLLLNIPTYTPYPRLLLPLLAAIWIASAAGIGWWIEACISVARRSAASGQRLRLSVMQLVVSGLVLVSVSLGLWTFNGSEVPAPMIHDSRLGMRDASQKVAELCRESAGVTASDESVVNPNPGLIVYAFGEPAVLYHLNQAGILASPVQDMKFPAARFYGEPLPTFLVFGPNSLRTPGFMYDWVDIEDRFEHMGDVPYDPSAIVLYNLFSPQWIFQHPAEEHVQRLEVYRLK